MRSCAFFIFEAATISIALVILRVLCTLLILVRISFEPAIAYFPSGFLVRSVLLEVLDCRGERLLAVGIEVLRRLELVDQRGVLALQERPQPALERKRLLDGDVVVIAAIDGKQ